jgi:hypothetical protein
MMTSQKSPLVKVKRRRRTKSASSAALLLRLTTPLCERAKSHAQNSRARFGGRNENEWRASVAEKKKKNEKHTHAKKWLSKGAVRGNNSSLHTRYHELAKF